MRKKDIQSRIEKGEPIFFTPNKRVYGVDAEVRRGESRYFGVGYPVKIESGKVLIQGVCMGNPIQVWVPMVKTSPENTPLIKSLAESMWMFHISLR